MMGTTTVTSYVESGAGVKAGGRTGMTSLVIGVLFLACLFLSPLATSLPKEMMGQHFYMWLFCLLETLRILNGMIFQNLLLRFWQ
jgi:xanthine/uracil/vitamin C permease (AzgA family)